MTKILHPVQKNTSKTKAVIDSKVTLLAYEVYSHIYSPQEAIITRNCRGGFHTGELIAFLYARNFPKSEWKQRVKEAFDGQEGL